MIKVLFLSVLESSSIQTVEVSEGNLPNQYSQNATVNVQSSGKDAEKDSSYYAEFPIHSIVLSTNSAYFKNLFGKTGMKEDKVYIIPMKVGQGEGKYLEKMVESFYDPEILNDMDWSDLVSLMVIGSRYICITFLGYCVKVLCEALIETVEEYDSLLVKLSELSIYDKLISSKLSDYTSQCLKNISEMLYPLEYKDDMHDTFMKLNSVTIMHLVKGNYAVTVKEDHFYLFVYKWFLIEKTRQDSTNISKFLQGIRMKNLEISFICSNFSLDDKILNNWEEYPKWLLRLMKKKLLLAKKIISGNKIEGKSGRIKPVDKCYRFVRLFSYQDGIFKDKSSNPFVWEGLFILPTVSLKKDGNSQYHLELSFYGYNIFDVSVEETITIKLPIFFTMKIGSTANITSEGITSSRGFRTGRLIFDDSKICNFGLVAKIDEAFLLEAKRNGVVLLVYMQKFDNFLWQYYDTMKSAKQSPLEM